jgi:hypothetical protein
MTASCCNFTKRQDQVAFGNSEQCIAMPCVWNPLQSIHPTTSVPMAHHGDAVFKWKKHTAPNSYSLNCNPSRTMGGHSECSFRTSCRFGSSVMSVHLVLETCDVRSVHRPQSQQDKQKNPLVLQNWRFDGIIASFGCACCKTESWRYVYTRTPTRPMHAAPATCCCVVLQPPKPLQNPTRREKTMHEENQKSNASAQACRFDSGNN